jgi:hypothetical protein
MTKDEKFTALGVIIGIIANSKARDIISGDLEDFLNWIKDKIEEEKE